MTVFHPIILDWFTQRYGEPTDIQSQSWPRIAGRENLLITAPTGSGKTLTAFLWTLNRFFTGDLASGSTLVIYISPLKALNNDIQRNLLLPLAELEDAFIAAGESVPDIKVQVRSGDTEPDDRRRMIRHPPEILITTPESLNLLLSSHGGRSLLYDIDTLILDEIHGVVDAKRGAYLMSAVERLVPLSGEFQRIALSATINPLEQVADYVAGFERMGDTYKKRSINILQSTVQKHYDIRIRYPEKAANRGSDEKIWDYLAEDILPRIHRNTSTLVFVNSRALCEKLTFKLNTAAGQTVAYAHHGSLSREIRTEVESRLKAGQLKAIVATSSLEMGIDIGALDEVILVQSPGSIASSIQRIGRAGHQVGVASRCTIYPTHPRDFLEAAVLARAIEEKALEPIHTVMKPLDVLGQIIVSMTGTERWDIDDLFSELKRSTAFHTLSRNEFDLVINMLLGRYADHHIRELKPRVRVDRSSNRIEARKGALLSLYLSGGVIPDRGYFQLRHEGDNARIGELDEEFVWEARVGQVFSLGTQTWQVKKITHTDVFVSAAKPGSSAPPFWKAEPLNRSFHYAEQINRFLEHANRQLQETDFKQMLIDRHAAEPKVAEEIMSFLERQREHCNRDLPHRHHLLFEQINSAPGQASGSQLVIHTGWGARVNRPFAMALDAAWQDRFSEHPEIFVANESVVCQLTHPLPADEILAMLPAHKLEDLLRKRLEGSGFFGARFRENAGRALLLSKGRFNERKPLWMSRLQSQRLMESVMKYEDFPILLETWRTCLQDEFDMGNLRLMLDEIEARNIQVSEVTTSTPSPFAQSAAWDQINLYMYRSDEPKAARQSNLREDLLQQLVFSPELRPAIAPEVIDQFVAQRQRLEAGWQPQDPVDLEDWIKERSLIPAAEWHALRTSLEFEPETGRFSWIADDRLVVAHDDADRFSMLLGGDDDGALETLLSNWLQFYGPVTLTAITSTLGVSEDRLAASLNNLLQSQGLVKGPLIIGDETDHYCDSNNYEYLLRLQRQAQRPLVNALPVTALPAFLYAWQTRSTAKDPLDQLYESLDKLRGLPLAASLWEAEVIPARIKAFATGQMDLLFQEGELLWLGLGEKKITFCRKDDLEVLLAEPHGPSALINDDRARYDLGALADNTGLSAHELSARLWQEVWQTRMTNDSMLALRRAIEADFKPLESMRQLSRGGKRRAFGQWRGRSPLIGNWLQVPEPDLELDAIEVQELDKERARLLLLRYGIVFRELTLRETDAMHWQPVFRALRLMELSGEIVSGRFFEGIPGPQFITPEALRCFHEDRSEQIFFINACDPASLSGMGLGAHGGDLPHRVVSNHLVYHGAALVLTVAKRGKALQFFVEPDCESIDRYLEVLGHLCYRSFQPVRRLTIETINGKGVLQSPYLKRLEENFNIMRDHRSITIQREI